jgi:hypothetical protein
MLDSAKAQGFWRLRRARDDKRLAGEEFPRRVNRIERAKLLHALSIASGNGRYGIAGAGAHNNHIGSGHFCWRCFCRWIWSRRAIAGRRNQEDLPDLKQVGVGDAIIGAQFVYGYAKILGNHKESIA